MNLVRTVVESRVFREWAARRGFKRSTFDLVDALLPAALPPGFRAPTDLLPIGADTILRAVLTNCVVPTHPEWVWPWWIERQLDPRSPDFVGRGHVSMALNVTHRNWTAVGVPGREHEAIVDPCGLLTPLPRAWSIDVWVWNGAGLVTAARSGGVRQTLREDLSGVVTRWQDGDLAVTRDARAGLIHGRAWVEETARVANLGAAPVAGALVVAVRPVNPEGIAPIFSVAFDGPTIRVGGVPVVTLDPPPPSVHASNAAGGDAASALPDRLAARTASCPLGLATGIALYPFSLTPGAATEVRFSCPLDNLPAEDLNLGHVTSTCPRFSPTIRESLAGTARVETSWTAFDRCFEANEAHLLCLWDGDAITPGPFTYHHFWFRDGAILLAALARIGKTAETARCLATFPARQRPDGFFLSQEGEWDAAGQGIWGLCEYARITGDRAFLARHYSSIRRAAFWIARARRETAFADDARRRGLFQAGLSAEHLGLPDAYYWDDFWGIAGLRCAAWAAAEMEEGADRALFAGEADEFVADVLRSVEASHPAVIPAAPGRAPDAGMIGGLAAVYPEPCLPPGHPRVGATLDLLRTDHFVDGLFYQAIVHSGLNIYLSLQIAMALLMRRDPSAWEIVRAAIGRATPTWTWPEAVNPRTGGGVMGDGHHGWAAAEFIHAARHAFFLEEEDRLTVFPAPPAEWLAPGGRAACRGFLSRFGPVDLSLAVEGDEVAIRLPAVWRRAPREIEVPSASGATRVRVDGVEVALGAAPLRVPPGTREVRLQAVSFRQSAVRQTLVQAES